MKKKNLKTVLLWLLALAPVVLTALVYSRLPDQIPTNWGLNGSVAYSDRWQIWIISGMSPFLAVMLRVLPKIDPRKRNYEKFQGAYDGFCIAMMLFLLAMTAVILSESFYPGRISVSMVVTALMGVLFVFLGNIMPKMKSNYFMGIKNPWTLSNTTVWNKTHRLAGMLWFAGGLVILISALLIKSGSLLFWLIMALVLVMTLIPTVMSYLWYQRLSPEEKEPR